MDYYTEEYKVFDASKLAIRQLKLYNAFDRGDYKIMRDYHLLYENLPLYSYNQRVHYEAQCPMAWSGKKVKSFKLSEDQRSLLIDFIVPGGAEYRKELSVKTLFEGKYGKAPQDEEAEEELEENVQAEGDGPEEPKEVHIKEVLQNQG